MPRSVFNMPNDFSSWIFTIGLTELIGLYPVKNSLLFQILGLNIVCVLVGMEDRLTRNNSFPPFFLFCYSIAEKWTSKLRLDRGMEEHTADSNCHYSGLYRSVN